MESRTPPRVREDRKSFWSAREHQAWIARNHDPSFDKFDLDKLSQGEVRARLICTPRPPGDRSPSGVP